MSRSFKRYRDDACSYCTRDSSGYMICCDRCDVWYHYKCINKAWDLPLTRQQVCEIECYYCYPCRRANPLLKVEYYAQRFFKLPTITRSTIRHETKRAHIATLYNNHDTTSLAATKKLLKDQPTSNNNNNDSNNNNNSNDKHQFKQCPDYADRRTSNSSIPLDTSTDGINTSRHNRRSLLSTTTIPVTGGNVTSDRLQSHHLRSESVDVAMSITCSNSSSSCASSISSESSLYYTSESPLSSSQSSDSSNSGASRRHRINK